VCTIGEQCGAGGTCEYDGHCSFFDSSCPSGRRWGEHAGSSSNFCVPTDVPDGSPGPDASTPPDGEDCVAESGIIPLGVTPGAPTTFVANLTCAVDDVALCGGAGRDLRYEFDLVDPQLVWVSATPSGGFTPALTLTAARCDAVPAVAGCSSNTCGDLDYIAAWLDSGTHCLIVDQTADADGQVTVTLLPTDVDPQPLSPNIDHYDNNCDEFDEWTPACVGVSDTDLTYYTVLCPGSHEVLTCPDPAGGYSPVLSVRTSPALGEVGCMFDNASLDCPAGAIVAFTLSMTTLVLSVIDGFPGDCGDYVVVVDPM
jgi:hypothetical protein